MELALNFQSQLLGRRISRQSRKVTGSSDGPKKQKKPKWDEIKPSSDARLMEEMENIYWKGVRNELAQMVLTLRE